MAPVEDLSTSQAGEGAELKHLKSLRSRYLAGADQAGLSRMVDGFLGYYNQLKGQEIRAGFTTQHVIVKYPLSLSSGELRLGTANPTAIKGLDLGELAKCFPTNIMEAEAFNTELSPYYRRLIEWRTGRDFVTVSELHRRVDRERNIWLSLNERAVLADSESRSGFSFRQALGVIIGGICLAEGHTYSSIRGGGGRAFMVRGHDGVYNDSVFAVPGYMLAENWGTKDGFSENDGNYYLVYGSGLENVSGLLQALADEGRMTGVVGW